MQNVTQILRYTDVMKLKLILIVYVHDELLFVKFGYFSVSCLAQSDIAYAVDSICIS